MKELIAHARELAASETLVIGNDVRETLTRLAAALEYKEKAAQQLKEENTKLQSELTQLNRQIQEFEVL